MVKFLRTFTEKTWQHFYRKTIPISKIILNLKFLTRLAFRIGTEVPTQAIYAFSKNLVYKIHLSLQDIVKIS